MTDELTALDVSTLPDLGRVAVDVPIIMPAPSAPPATARSGPSMTIEEAKKLLAIPPTSEELARRHEIIRPHTCTPERRRDHATQHG